MRSKIIQKIKALSWSILWWLDQWLWSLSGLAAPNRFQKTILSLVYHTRTALMYFLTREVSRAQIWCGQGSGCGGLLKVAYIGDRQSYKARSPEYLKKILFAPGEITIEEKGSTTDSNAYRLASTLANEVDLVILEANYLRHWQPKTGQFQFSPVYINMEFRFSPGQSWESIEKGMHAQKQNIKRFRHAGLTAEASKDENDFDHFYDQMHLPMVEQRHPGYGVTLAKEEMRKLFHQGGLMLIREPDGEVVATSLFNLQKQTMLCIAYGYLDGSPTYLNLGTNGAMYYYALRWCFDNNYPVCNIGRTRPFATDGLYLYKKHWNLTPALDYWNTREWLFWIPNGSPAGIEWINTHPLVKVNKT